MKGYFISEKQMNELREKCEHAWLRHAAHHHIDPQLCNNSKDSSRDLWASINMAVCRWRDEVGRDG